jgi:hypothetical protein
VTPPGAVPVPPGAIVSVGLVVVVTCDVVVVVDVVDDVELLPESPLPPQPTVNVSTAAPPINAIVALDIVLDPRGMRPSLPC